MNATKQATHTPGPWSASCTSHHAHDYRLSRPNGPMDFDKAEGYANARLIAAAPDLLAALQSLLPWMHLLGDHIGNGVLADPHGHGVPIGDDERCRAILAARAVLDRATGYA